MKLLAIDASTKVAGAALLEDGTLVCECNLTSGLTQSEKLLPLIDQCLKLAGWRPGEIDVFAAVAGPGSFTGVRIGVSTVKGMAEAHGRPVVAVGTLEVLAAAFPAFGGVVVPILDARRAEVYSAAYRDGAEVLPPAPRALAALLADPALAGPVLFCGDGVPPYRAAIEDALGERAHFAPPHLLLQRAGAAAWLAWRKAKAGGTMDAAALLPNYLRLSQAEQARARQEGTL